MTEPQTIFAPHPEKHKESLVSPVEQWDQVAFQLIHKELAPKGFKEINHGAYRGKVVSNIPFLPKNVVQNCQKIGAQLVRAYRENTKKEVKEMKENFIWKADVYNKELLKLSIFSFKKRKEVRRKIAECESKAEILNGMFNRLDQIRIK